LWNVSGHGPPQLGPWPFSRPFGLITGLALFGFRNLADGALAVPDAGFVIVGPNGHGKTSLLEALLYCEVFRSFRGAADRELVSFGQDGFRVAVDLKRGAGGRGGGGTVRAVAAGFDVRTKEKRITVDGAVIPRAQDAIGIVRGVVLSPGDVSLVAGGPKERRRYLDVLLSLTVPGYVAALARYRRALAHRTRATGSEMPAWERMLAERGAVLVDARRRWTAQWQARYAALCGAMGERGAAALVYHPSVDGDADALAAALEQHRARDVARGRTGAGPHRDRLTVTLDGRDLRTYGSAGQQRTAAIALRLCEAESLRQHSGEPVTLCLDDAFAELDLDRTARLGALIESQTTAGSQVIAAVPKAGEVPSSLAVLEVRGIREGRIE
jgi:DNA replication and repair protein RecF